MNTDLRIIQLKAENIKNLKAIEIKPDGAVITLTGKNEAGKSSVLDAIEVALAGKKLEDPIRHGEEKAVSEVDLGEYIVRRVFTKKGDRLELINKDGFKTSSPQGLLNNILGKLSFDPLAFANMDKTPAGKREQRNVLMDLIGLDFSDLDKQHSETFQNRATLNRIIRDKEGVIKEKVEPLENLPDKESSIDAHIAKLESLKDEQVLRETYIGVLEHKQNSIKRSKKEIEEITNKIKDLQDIVTQHTVNIEDSEKEIANAKVPRVVELQEIVDVKDEIAQIQQQNKYIVYAREYYKEKEEIRDKTKESNELTEKIQGIETEKKKRISEAKYPVKGLSVNTETVLFNGIPFSQNSTSRKIRVSTAIAMALNPKLKEILIRDGSSLDTGSLKEIEELVKGKGYQLWMEVVDESGKVGIFIEDGNIKNREGGKNAI